MSLLTESSFEQYLLILTDVFRWRGAENWIVLAIGLVLQTGRKSTAGLIRAAGVIVTKSFAAYFRFLVRTAGHRIRFGRGFSGWSLNV